jgi:hypothetical protein
VLQQLASDCDMNDTLWDRELEEENGGDSHSPSVASSDASTSLISWAFQAALPQIVAQHGDRSPSPQSVASYTMHSGSFALARYVEPHYHPPYYDADSGHVHLYDAPPDSSTSTNPLMSIGEFVPQAHHDHIIQPALPCVQHQPLQEQDSFHISSSVYAEAKDEDKEDFLCTTSIASPAQMQAFHDSLPMDLDRRNPADESPLHEYSAKSPRGKELFVCHIPSEIANEELRDLFSQYGVVISFSIVRHKQRKSKCFAFVKFKLQSAADEALLRLNDHEVSLKCNPLTKEFDRSCLS